MITACTQAKETVGSCDKIVSHIQYRKWSGSVGANVWGKSGKQRPANLEAAPIFFSRPKCDLSSLCCPNIDAAVHARQVAF